MINPRVILNIHKSGSHRPKSYAQTKGSKRGPVMGHVVDSPVRAYTDFGTRDDASHPRRVVLVPPCAEMVLPRVLVILLVCCCLVTAGKMHSEPKVMPSSQAR